MKYYIEFNAAELRAVVGVLQQGPYVTVAGILASIDRQAREQDAVEQNAQQAASEREWADGKSPPAKVRRIEQTAA